MESRTISVNHRLMLRTATLAQEVLERAKTRKLNWPAGFQSKTFRKSDGEDADLNAAFASVAEHMGHISEECEKYYCCVPPFQFKEYEVAHIFRYHSRQASENLLKAFEDEERENGPIVEEPGCTDAESSALISAQKTVNKFQLTPEQKCRYFLVVSVSVSALHPRGAGGSSSFLIHWLAGRHLTWWFLM